MGGECTIYNVRFTIMARGSRRLRGFGVEKVEKVEKVERIAVEVFASLGVVSAIPILLKAFLFISISKKRIGVPDV